MELFVIALLGHFVGDYLLQSDWMAQEKTSRWFPAICHGITYGLPFLLVTQWWLPLLIIVGTHIVIDRYRLAKYVVWAKNFLAPRRYWYPLEQCKTTGYPDDRPAWLTVWLMIIADNTIHIVINFVTLFGLGVLTP